MPTFLYGTAWKEGATRRLTRLALERGFRGVDTANQRKHYFEAAVGEALGEAGLPRGEVFLQSKFTYRRGQDHRLPYDPGAPLPEQVRQSFDSSLAHLGVDRVDAYLLHGPAARDGLTRDDWQVWRAMEALHDAGRARLLGVSNISRGQLAALLDGAKVPPRLVQNRCYAARGWGADVRALCARAGAVYQGFSLLTANRQVLRAPALRAIAARRGRTPAQVIFRFALQSGMICLTGTTDPAHMDADLAAYDFALSDAEVAAVAALG